MAVLIVDDEANTREALKNLLDRSGIGTLLEARNGQEALKTITAAPARIDLIVADWEMPHMDGLQLLKELARVPSLDIIPFLLITSDLSDAVLTNFHAENPRLDHHLIKPFRMKALVDAMGEAARRRAATRSDVLVLAPEDAPFRAALSGALRSGAGHWKETHFASSQADLTHQLEARGARVGCVLVSPAALPWLDLDWLSSFKKTPVGAATPLVALSREPLAIRPIRTQCQFYVEVPATDQPSWSATLAKLSRALISDWQVRHVLKDMKALTQREDYKTARKHFTTLFKLDDFSADVHLTAGEVCEGLGDLEGACRQYGFAAEANPCIPRCYIKLLALGENPARLAETAVQFCPGNVDVLLAAARAWQGNAETGRAREAVLQALTAAPGHKDAEALLVTLK